MDNETNVKLNEQTKTRTDRLDKIIEVMNVSKKFGEVTVVDDMSLSIKRGEFVTLLGPSGCGKTTLLRMIAGFEMPTYGKIFLERADVTYMPPHKRSINTVFQKYALFPHLNVFNNISFGLKVKKIDSGKTTYKNGVDIPVMRKLTKKEIEDKVNGALKMVGLTDYGHRDVNSLSGGQQQRVAIARALVCEPKVLLLDEPLGALDLKMRKDMQIELMAMHKNLGITFVYVTHDQEEALTMSDKIVVIKDGVIQQIGTPKKIYDEPANAFVANFIGESNILSGVMKADYKVNFCGVDFKCEDKGFTENESVDLVIRPEDIDVYDIDNEKGQLKGFVVSSVFKGTYYEMNILANSYEFTVQSTDEMRVGNNVNIDIVPNAIHIMKKQKTTNEFYTEINGENSVKLCEGTFPFAASESFEVGDRVKATIPFDKVELVDDENDGIIGGNIAQTLYKGTYFQVQVYTDDDQDFFVDTVDEWDIDDRVGICIKPENISVKMLNAMETAMLDAEENANE